MELGRRPRTNSRQNRVGIRAPGVLRRAKSRTIKLRAAHVHAPPGRHPKASYPHKDTQVAHHDKTPEQDTCGFWTRFGEQAGPPHTRTHTRPARSSRSQVRLIRRLPAARRRSRQTLWRRSPVPLAEECVARQGPRSPKGGELSTDHRQGSAWAAVVAECELAQVVLSTAPTSGASERSVLFVLVLRNFRVDLGPHRSIIHRFRPYLVQAKPVLAE